MTSWVRLESHWLDDEIARLAKLPGKTGKWPNLLVYLYLRRLQDQACHAFLNKRPFELPSIGELQRLTGRGRGWLHRLVKDPSEWGDPKRTSTWRVVQVRCGAEWPRVVKVQPASSLLEAAAMLSKRSRERSGNDEGTRRERRGNGEGTATTNNGGGSGGTRERRGNGEGTKRERGGNDQGTGTYGSRARIGETLNPKPSTPSFSLSGAAAPRPDLEQHLSTALDTFRRVRTEYLRLRGGHPPGWTAPPFDEERWHVAFRDRINASGSEAYTAVMQWALWSQTKRAEQLRNPDHKRILGETPCGKLFDEYANLANLEGFPVPWPESVAPAVEPGERLQALLDLVVDGPVSFADLRGKLRVDDEELLTLVGDAPGLDVHYTGSDPDAWTVAVAGTDTAPDAAEVIGLDTARARRAGGADDVRW